MKLKLSTPLFFADFETTTYNSKQYQDEGHTNVWMWALMDQKNGIKIGNNLDEFMDFILQDGKNKIIYFHNLSFDGDFIIKWLFRNYPKNFKQDYQFTTENYEVVNQVPKYNWFSFFKNGNKIYNIDWSVRKKIRNKIMKVKIQFRCSYNLMPSSIDSLGKSFKINKMDEEEINNLIKKGYIKEKNEFYDLGGNYVHQDEYLKNVFVSYIKRDVMIAKTAFLNYKETVENTKDAINNKYNKKDVHLQKILTTASLVQKLVKNNIWNNKHLHNYIKRGLKIHSYDQYELMRKFYSGGFTQFNPLYHNKVFDKKGFSIDINSSYPWAMTQPLPYGELLDEPPKKTQNYLTYCVVKMSYKIKSKYINFICLKNKTDKRVRYSMHGSGEFYFLLEELEFYKKIYDIEINEIKYLYARCFTFLKPFIDEYYHLKSEADANGQAALKTTYKLLLNSLYGSFAKKAIYPMGIWMEKRFYDALKNNELDGLYDEKNKKWNAKTFKQSTIPNMDLFCVEMEKEEKPKSFPNMLIGATITAYSRLKLLNAIFEIGVDKFVYCDTDSIFCLGKKENLPSSIKLDDYELGAWKVEFEFNKGKILGAKRYVFENENHKTKSATSGIKLKKLSEFDEIEKMLNSDYEVKNARLQRCTDDYGIYLKPINLILKTGTN